MSYQQQAIALIAVLATCLFLCNPYTGPWFLKDPNAKLARLHRYDATSGEVSSYAT